MLQISLFRRILVLVVCLAGLVFAAPNAFYKRVETANDAAALIENGDVSAETAAKAADWPSYFPSLLVNLGLDLRGGAHLLAEVQVDDVHQSRMDSLWPDVRDALRQERATIGSIRREEAVENGEMRIRISEPSQIQAAVQAVRSLAEPVQSLSSAGASNLDVTSNGDLVIVNFSDAEISAQNARTMEQSLEIIRRRVDEAGTREPTIQRQGEDRILIQVPGVGSAEELKGIIGKTAQLNLYGVVGQTSDANARVGINQILLPDAQLETVFYILEMPAVLSGENLVDAQPAFDPNSRPAVNFRLNAQGARIFGDYTAAHIGQPFAIVLDDEVLSAPTIQSHIPGGSGIITGNFTVEETTLLSIQLRAGALPAELTYLEERTVGPELGQDSIEAGALACAIAFITVLIFMLLSYGRFGIYANIALVANIALILALLSIIGGTLTLPGIAGIVLTVGMAVDANVLIFERIREELKAGKGPARAIELGYERAFSAIIDANITTFIAAVILYVLGSGPVRGFAITLGLGIITSVFTAFWVTRILVILWLERRKPKEITV